MKLTSLPMMEPLVRISSIHRSVLLINKTIKVFIKIIKNEYKSNMYTAFESTSNVNVVSGGCCFHVEYRMM